MLSMIDYVANSVLLHTVQNVDHSISRNGDADLSSGW